MSFYVYDFAETTADLYHPSVGAFSAYGEGIGEVTITRANDITAHEASSDGVVLINKSIKKNGTVTFNALRASNFDQWLNKLAKYLETSSSSEFAMLEITITNPTTKETWYCTGCSHQKLPDAGYKAQVDYRSWSFMSANVELQ